MIQAQPMDACILIGGCDKTVPAQLMGSISSNKPIVPIVTGPMMPGSHRGVRLGACTDCRSNWAAYRAGEIDIEDISSLNAELVPTGGTCGVMLRTCLLQPSNPQLLTFTRPRRAQWHASQLHWG